ncbi:hypothetical protein GT037_002119 [Alternaria burnsii]|uniref:Rhodopsin domain-containing protein n=1 Tax=Alternaria burnsii TaxID=1187904 RepID=A0A8H7BBQ6_9PLEO|nr:uncharacterized protein GT037_002119 [Alternaria burnsii]KAF7680468.1 hypothetical protein GT037_002119 [Alternaria burnsii]
MYAASKAPVSKDVLLCTNIVMLLLTSGLALTRAVPQIVKREPFELPDLFVYFAFCLFVALWACYHVVASSIYRAYAVLEGKTEPYATMKNDAIAMLKFLVTGQMCFYTLLISVKMSLLTLYRKLLAGLPRIYRKIWWSIVTFCVLAWVGSIVGTLTTCDDLDAESREGQCGGTANEDQRVIFSLYFAYSVDVTTDLAVMFLPLRLTWNLQMPRKQKIAIMIACSPAFASFIRKHMDTKKASYNAQGFLEQGTDEIEMKSIVSPSGRRNRDVADIYWEDTHSSQEEPANNAGRIMVKTTVHQNNEISTHSSKHGVTS